MENERGAFHLTMLMIVMPAFLFSEVFGKRDLRMQSHDILSRLSLIF